MENPVLPSSRRRFIIVWFDGIALTTNDNGQTMKTKLEEIADTVIIFDDGNGCADYINSIEDVKILLIVNESNGRSVVKRLLDHSKIKSIYVLSSDRSMHVPWLLEYKEINCVTTDISSIFEQIKWRIRSNSIGFNIADESLLSSTTLDINNKQEAMFMYGQLLKNVLTKMNYSNDDKDEMIEFLKTKCENNPKNIEYIGEFQNEYASKTPVEWYSIHPFIYSILNAGLRTHDVNVLWSMRFFIKDLHGQIVKIYENTEKGKTETFYRGQVIPTPEFEKKRPKKGGLLSINSFLSTSSNKDVAEMFAAENPPIGKTSMMFVIHIDQSITSNVYCANIQSFSRYKYEEEYLFTMGSVFRIESIEQSDGNGTWFIHLKWTTDHDVELTRLANSVLPERENVGLHSLYTVMLFMGEYEQILKVGDAVIKTPKDRSDSFLLHNILGFTNFAIGHYQQALIQFQLASNYYHRLYDETVECLSHSWIKAIIFLVEGKLDLAIESLLAIERNPEYHLIKDRVLFDLVFYLMLGIVCYRQGRISDALSYQTKALDIAKKELPPIHPFIGECYDQLFATYMFEGRMDEAFLCLKESVDIKNRSTPSEHIESVYTRGVLNIFRYKKNDISRNKFNSECLSIIQQKWLSDSRQSPMKLLIQGRSYAFANQLDEALTVLSQFITIRREDLFSQDPCLILAYSLIGYCHLLKRNLPEALENLQEAFKVAVQYSKDTNPHPVLFFCSHLLAIVYAQQDNYDEALKTLKQCQTLATDKLNNMISYFGIDSVSTGVITSFRERALEHVACKEYEEALRRFQNCLQIQLTCLPPNHPDIADTHSSIGEIYDLQENYTDAIESYQEALTIQQCHLPTTYPKIADSFMKLGLLYCIREQFDQSLFAYDEALKILSRLSSPKHSNMATIYCGIGLNYTGTKKYDDALLNFQKSLNILRENPPTDLSRLADTLKYIGRMFIEKEDFPAALNYYQQALNAELECLPSTHLKLTKSWQQLAIVYKKLDRYEHALNAYKECLKIQSETLPPKPIDLAVTHKEIGSIYFKTEKYDDALRSFEECLDIQKSSFPENHPHLADTFLNLGETLFQLSKLSPALTAYENALNILRKCSPPPTDLIMWKTWTCLGCIYYQSQQYDLALEHFQNGLSIEIGWLPTEYYSLANIYTLMGNIYFKRETFSDAVVYYQQALEIHLKCSSLAIEEISQLQKRLGDIYIAMNNYEQSLFYYYEFLTNQRVSPISIKASFGIKQIIEEAYFAKYQYENDWSKWQGFLDFQRQSLPSDHPHLAPTYVQIGNALLEQQNFSNALDSYHFALDILLKYLSPTNSQIEEMSIKIVNNSLVDIYIQIGLALIKQEKFSEAFVSCQKAEDILLNRPLSLTDREISLYWNKLGRFYVEMNDYKQALFAFNKYFAITRTTSSTAEIDVCSTIIIKDTYFAKHHYEDDLSKWQDFLQFQSKTLPSNHHHLASTYTSIGDALCQLEILSQALDSYQRAVDILTGYFSVNDSEISENRKAADNHTLASTHSKIGDVFRLQKNWSEALQSYKDAQDILCRFSSVMNGGINEMTMRFRNFLIFVLHYRIGEIFYEQNKLSEALNSYQDARNNLLLFSSTMNSILAEVLMKNEKISLKDIFIRISTLLIEQKKFSEALANYQHALNMQKRSHFSPNLDTGEILFKLGEVHFSVQQYDEALANYEECLTIQKSLLPPDDAQIGLTSYFISLTFMGQSKLPECKVYLQETANIFFNSPLPNESITAQVFDILAEVNTQLCLYDEALSAYRTCFDIRNKYLSPDHIEILETVENIYDIEQLISRI